MTRLYNTDLLALRHIPGEGDAGGGVMGFRQWSPVFPLKEPAIDWFIIAGANSGSNPFGGFNPHWVKTPTEPKKKFRR